MYTANDIRNARFPTNMKGYNQDAVDDFLDTVENDYNEFEEKISELNNQITALKKESDELRISQSGIQNVLISAQKLADQIISEAQQKAEEIIVEAKVRANEITQTVDAQIANDKRIADQNKQKAEAEYVAIMKTTAEKSQEMVTAAHDSVARQQLLFDKLKLDIVNFKSQIMSVYKEHIDALSKLPDEVPFDATHAAEAAAFAYDSRPTFGVTTEESVAEKTVEEPQEEEVVEEILTPPTAEEEPEVEPMLEETEDVIEEPDVQLGFRIQMDEEPLLAEDDEDEDEDEEEPKLGFFKRKR